MTEWSQNLALILGNLLVAIIVAVVTIRLSIRQFHSTRWWEKKAEVYTRLVEAAAALLRFFWVKEGELLANVDFKGSETERRSGEAREARHTLEVAAAAGAYLISDDAHHALQKLRVTIVEGYYYRYGLEELWEQMTAVEECLSTLRRCAEEDLRPKHSVLRDFTRSIEQWMSQIDKSERERRGDT
jgi:hypothetical protein